MTEPTPYDTSRYGRLYQDARRQEELLAPLSDDQRAEVRRLHRETPWSLEECVLHVTKPLAAAFPEITPAGLDRLMAAVKAQEAEPLEGVRPGDTTVPGLTSGKLRPRGPIHRLLGWVYGLVCNTYARVLLRDPSFTLTELRDLHALADEELPPHLAAQAQRIISAEISRRSRKDY